MFQTHLSINVEA